MLRKPGADVALLLAAAAGRRLGGIVVEGRVVVAGEDGGVARVTEQLLGCRAEAVAAGAAAVEEIQPNALAIGSEDGIGSLGRRDGRERGLVGHCGKSGGREEKGRGGKEEERGGGKKKEKKTRAVTLVRPLPETNWLDARGLRQECSPKNTKLCRNNAEENDTTVSPNGLVQGDEERAREKHGKGRNNLFDKKEGRSSSTANSSAAPSLDPEEETRVLSSRAPTRAFIGSLLLLSGDLSVAAA